MISPFDQAEILMAGAINTMFGEAVLVTLMKPGKIVIGGPDPSRPAFQVKGVADVDQAADHPTGAGTRHGGIAEMQTTEATVAIDRSWFLAANLVPAAGDTLTLVERFDQPVFRVVTSRPIGQATIEFVVTPVAA